MAESKAPVVILLMFLLFGAAGAFYYFFIYKKTEATPSPSPSVSTTDSPTSTDSPASTDSTTSTSTSPPASTTSPPPVSYSTLESLLASGRGLESEEIDIGAGKKKVTYQPVITDKSKVTYTLSMDIKVDKNFVGDLFHVIQNTDAVNWPNGTTERRPTIYISGVARNTADKMPLHSIVVNHTSEPGKNEFAITTFTATLGTYFNLTCVIENGTWTTYINGVKDTAGSFSAAFTWSTGTDNWTWNQPNFTDNSIKVKNVYFFNRALTLSEVELIGKKQTSGVSTYMLPPPTYKVASQPSIQMTDI
jgi:cytoskeletal protein RodZ